MEDFLKRLTFKKLQLDQLQPLPDPAMRELEQWMRVELTYSSNAIEGNTLTRLETAELLEKGIGATVSAKPLRDQLEALSHAKALDLVRSLASCYHSHNDIQMNDILAIHRSILGSIDEEWAGRFRQSIVFVRGAGVNFPIPRDVPYHMDEFMQWLNEATAHPVQSAADAHFKLVTIHPFVDGNGRTARLVMNLILGIYGYPMIAIKSSERTRYLEAVNSAQIKGDFTAFYALIAAGLERSLEAYLSTARGKADLSRFNDPEKRSLLKIGELAQATHETVPTLRFWTQRGLVSASGTTPGGYQLYEPSTVERVKQIRELQVSKRLTLAEVKQALEAA